MNKFPALYKKTSTGAIQYWKIYVYPESDGSGVIETKFGQLGGKEQITEDVVSIGKNLGKINETTPFDQACLEAKSKWEGKLKKGYVEKTQDAEDEKTDKIIEGGILPMLAHKYSEQGHKIKFPCLAQPKLDGIRCIAILKNGKCTLWSRTRKLITSVPHINRAIERGGHQDNLVFDGELYNHAYKDNFEEIVHFVRQETPIPGHEIVQYHIYDTIQGGHNWERQSWLGKEFQEEKIGSPIVLVKTITLNWDWEVNDYYEMCMASDYEGAILRNKQGKYVNKRSYDLQKVKKFDDAEFPIIGIEEGRGKLAGHVGAFICETESGVCFKAKMSGDTDMLKKYFQNASLWKDQELVVQYQGLTGANKVPRFPVGLRIKEKI